MREIEFRGKLDGADKWVYGYYYGGYNWADFIISNEGFEHRQRVKHETIGQYTGIKDKNGTKIFEGDILKVGENLTAKIYYIENNVDDYGDEINCAFHAVIIGHNKTIPLDGYFKKNCYIIGNLHDNPKLLNID